PACAEDESHEADQPRISGTAVDGPARVAMITQKICEADKDCDRGEAGSDRQRGRVVWDNVHTFQRLLRPAIPCNGAADQKHDACRYQAALSQPGLLSPCREEKLGDLNRYQDDPDTFVSKHEKEVDPVDAQVPAERSVHTRERQRSQRRLLNYELFRN